MDQMINELQILKNMIHLQKQMCSIDGFADSYMIGMYNGMEVMLATMEHRLPEFLDYIVSKDEISELKNRIVLLELKVAGLNYHNERPWTMPHITYDKGTYVIPKNPDYTITCDTKSEDFVSTTLNNSRLKVDRE